jgi:aspartyl-tRNA(Asn)/glutamyl-tRNA(Gln) amidotransferase subunit A
VADRDLCLVSAEEQSKLIATKEVSPVELVHAHLDRIGATEPVLNSFITRPGEQAMVAARRAEKEIASGRYRGPLHGLPVGLKDLYYVKGVRNTSGSKIFDNFVPDYDSAAASRLKEAGAILMGKLNLHQFAFGPTGLNRDYGDMHNPWDPQRLAGGSSGGSASAAATGQCAITLGTDTGGSVRIPSALCGLAGIKPTYGRVSRYGLVALSWSLDHPGPMARTVEDCALTLNVLAGYDARDPASAREPVPDYRAALTGDVRGLRIGVPREYFEVPLDPGVKDRVMEALKVLDGLGARVQEINWPLFHQSASISSVIIYAESAAYHRDLVLSRGKEYDPSVRWRLEVGLFISAEEYLQALRAREVYTHEALDLLREVDVIAGPTEPVVAPLIDAQGIEIEGKEVGSIAALTQYTRPFNITGFPAVTVPCGFSEGLPVGLQLAGRPFEEATILNTGYAYQQATDWHTRRPPL